MCACCGLASELGAGILVHIAQPIKKNASHVIFFIGIPHQSLATVRHPARPDGPDKINTISSRITNYGRLTTDAGQHSEYGQRYFFAFPADLARRPDAGWAA